MYSTNGMGRERKWEGEKRNEGNGRIASRRRKGQVKTTGLRGVGKIFFFYLLFPPSYSYSICLLLEEKKEERRGMSEGGGTTTQKHVVQKNETLVVCLVLFV